MNATRIKSRMRTKHKKTEKRIIDRKATTIAQRDSKERPWNGFNMGRSTSKQNKQRKVFNWIQL